MKKGLLLCFFFFLTPVAFGGNQEIEKFIGIWMSDGRVQFIAEAQGDSIALEAPVTQGWKTEFKDVQVKDGKLTFNTLSTREEGTPSSHGPYYHEIYEDADGIMWMRLSSKPSLENTSKILLVKLWMDNPETSTPPPGRSGLGKAGDEGRHQNRAARAQDDINIMEVVLFLNANQARNGSASFKTDREKKTLQYFDAEGRIMEESYIDENNNIITKTFNVTGDVTSHATITPEDIEEYITQESDYAKEIKRVAKVALNKLAAAAEAYRTSHDGQYPTDIKELLGKTSALPRDYCAEGMEQYKFSCEFRADGYTLTATPRFFKDNPGNLTYRMITGKVLEEIDPGKQRK